MGVYGINFHVPGRTYASFRDTLPEENALASAPAPVGETPPARHYRGVTHRPDIKRFEVKFAKRYVGRFKTPQEAARAYDQVARARLGRKAILNFPGE